MPGLVGRYISAWLARRGARPVGLDNSAAQLATAAALQDRFGLRFPLIHASAEQIPLADAAFDLVISEYGASICAAARPVSSRAGEPGSPRGRPPRRPPPGPHARACRGCSPSGSSGPAR